MNRKIFLAALLLLAAGLQTAWAQSVIVSLKTGRTAIYDLADVDSIIFSEPDEVTEHKFVDLGLPSGTLWAACNVGAKKPEECGDYFAWGETVPKNDYTWGNYAYCNGSDKSMTKYCLRGEYGYNGFIDYLTELEPEDDAATANWGSEWEMPSLEQCQELLDTRYTATIWETVNGVEGRRIRSYVNGNSIFLPAAGFFYNGRIDKLGTQCLYWTRNLSLGDSNQAYDLWFTYITERMSSGFRYDGQSIRPVRKLRERVLVNEISLNTSTLKLLSGESAKLTATLLPSDATNSIVWWESSDESIATVDIYGNVTANAVGTCNITCHTTDGTDLYAYCDVYVTSPEYVDLGLPSGTLWATFNLGAHSPEEDGNYYAWGETSGKWEYSWEQYRYYDINDYSLTKYCTQSNKGIVDDLTELLPEDDAATANWGSEWQTPSLEDFSELMNSDFTTSAWTTQDGKYGFKITSKKNGNSIFLPAAGYCYETTFDADDENGCYWSRTLATDAPLKAQAQFFSAYGAGTSALERMYGLSIRPVRVEKKIEVVREYVEIGGLKWATMNVGATTVAGSWETCCGDYFAWSETEPRYASIVHTSGGAATFTWKNDYTSGYYESNVYPSYTNNALDETHDVATVHWGGNWRTPTPEDFRALEEACYSGSMGNVRLTSLTGKVTTGGIYWLDKDQTYEPDYAGIAGVLFVDKQNISKRVFFPAAGRITRTQFDGWLCYYWTSSLYAGGPEVLNMIAYAPQYINVYYYQYWYYGFSVRPVSN